jgi:predicted permease
MGQLALSLVMLTVGGIFLRSAVQAEHLDPGFSFDRGVIVHVDARLGNLPPDRISATYAEILDRLRARPDVAAAGAASIIPFGDIDENAAVQRAGAPLPTGAPGLVEAEYTAIGSNYFGALGLPVLAGRDFTVQEERASRGERIAIIDRPLATKLFGTADPVGQLVQYAVRTGQPPVSMRVTGVVPGLRHDVFDTAPVPHVYVPLGQVSRTDVYFHIKTLAPTAESETTLLPSLRRTVESVDAALPVLSVETRASYRDHNLLFALLRLGAAVFMVFGGVALVLATVGVYGVKAYVVSNRTREIGIRIALGATPKRVVWTVVREGFVLSMAGLGVGLVLSLVTSSGMRAMTLEARGADAATTIGAMVVLALAAAAASWIPARRATRVQPTTSLRAD